MFPKTGMPNLTDGGASFGRRRKVDTSARNMHATKADAPASRAVRGISIIACNISLTLSACSEPNLDYNSCAEHDPISFS